LNWSEAPASATSVIPSEAAESPSESSERLGKDLRAALVPFSYTRFMTGKLISGEHEYVMGSDFGHTL